MSYGPNLLINPEANSGLLGWENVNVTVEDGTTPSVNLKPQIGDSHTLLWGNWFAYVTPQLVYEGLDGTKYFNLKPDALLRQVVPVSVIGDLPEYDFALSIDFKLSVPQELEDSSVKGWLEAEVLYSDKTMDLYIIPCVVGLVTAERGLSNYWLRGSANIFLRPKLNLTSITITVKTMEA